MADTTALSLAACIFAAAVLYSAVGHAGASGYLAAMALFGVSAQAMKPSALVLNILVASIATLRFCRAGCLPWRTIWPFVLGSVPLSFAGGALQIPEEVYRPAVGAILLLAALRLVWPPRASMEYAPRIPTGAAIGAGAAIGLLSGLTGTGGGVFLSPLLLFTGWAGLRETAGLSAVFILVNSVAGLLGHLAGMRFLPAALPLWMAAAGIGALVGTGIGSRKLPPPALRRLLALVLLLGAARLVVP